MIGNTVINQQLHAYRGGHELISSSVRLASRDQDVVDRLSDLAGPIGPGEKFSPYLCLYPLPSGEHYVFARTWQDLSAPRAGCVVTRSLLIPMEVWSHATGLIATLLDRLNYSIERLDVSEVLTIQVGHATPLEPVSDGLVGELVEALFLESRQSIAILDAPTPELITARLLESFWPALRRNFSVCTHAYSPRMIEGRPFDLLFAPKGAWSNYGHFQGRQIDGKTNLKARHRWTELLAEQIFERAVPAPLLQSFGTLDTGGDEADESTLRLFLMWTELIQRAQSSPQAVLGLLDIATNRRDPSLLHGLLPLISASIELASRNFSAGEMLAYLRTLLGKFPSELPPTALLRRIRSCSEDASFREPAAAIDELAQAVDHPVPVVICAGIGDGLASTPRLPDLGRTILHVGADSLQLLLCYSPKFARRFVELVEAAGDYQQFQELSSILETRDHARRRRLRRNLLRHFHSSEWAPSLTPLLASSTPASLGDAVKSLWAANQFRDPRFAVNLRAAADDAKKLGALRLALLALPSTPATNEAILTTVSLNDLDVEWLASTSADEMRKSEWCHSLVCRANDWQIRTLSERTAENLINILSVGLPNTAASVAAILLQFDSILANNIATVYKIASNLDSVSMSRIVSTSLEAILSGRARCQSWEASSFVNSFAGQVAARDLVLMIAGTRINIERVSENLVLLSETTDHVKNILAPKVDELTELLTKRHGPIPRADAIDSLARFIQYSGRVAGAAQLRAASTALQYALNRRYLEVSSLVVACFPIVYEELRQSRSTPSFLSYFTFVDWDRCRSARNELVDAFLSAVWQPADLVATAVAVNELPEIVDILQQRRKGRDYIAGLIAAQNIPHEYRSYIHALADRRR